MAKRKKKEQEQKDVIDAVLEDLKKREISLYLQKQSFLEKIFDTAEKEKWLEEIAESKSGKRFLLELAIKSNDFVIERLLPEKLDVKVEGEVLQFIADLRKVLNENASDSK